jgi:hypothetical protein
MKTLIICLLALAALGRASAQVQLELAQDQSQFLPQEAIRLTVKISNTSGQIIHLGTDPDWLTFDVESIDQEVVIKNSDVPVVEPFDLESSQLGIKHVDLQPHFQFNRIGRYRVKATMRIKSWGLTVTSTPIYFDIIHGAELWSQPFGVMVSTNPTPEPRKYALIKANFLREQLRLYLQVGNADDTQIHTITPLGPMVSFSTPEQRVDRENRLHVLWQTGAQSFSYTVAAADGSIVLRDTYDNFNSRPHLTVATDGEVMVTGGVRRLKPEDVPRLKTLPMASALGQTNPPAGTSTNLPPTGN